MSREYELHIRKLQSRAILSFAFVLIALISLGLGILLAFIGALASVIFFSIAAIAIVYLVFQSKIAKKEEREQAYKPIIFNTSKTLSFEETVAVFENLTDKENRITLSEEVRFFRFEKIFKIRTVIYKTDDFDKNKFDNAKDRINKKANKALNISPWISKAEAFKAMRFNIIYTASPNDALYKFLAQNANHNLTRAEGIICIAIVGTQIIIPPLYGRCDLAEIQRYKGVIKFINQVLLNE